MFRPTSAKDVSVIPGHVRLAKSPTASNGTRKDDRAILQGPVLLSFHH